MSSISVFGAAHDAAHSVANAANGAGWWRRFYDRLIEARARQAGEVMRQHRHLLPRELEQAGWKLGERSEDSLPFVR